MALVRETIGKFKGFGNDGNTPGEFLLSQNIKKTNFGCKVGWCTIPNPRSDLSLYPFSPTYPIRSFTDGPYNGSDGTWAQDSIGRLYNSTFFPMSIYYTPKSNACNGDGGLITDQKGRLIYAGTRYVGMYTGGADATAGSISVTNGSTAVVGSGTGFNSATVGQVIKIDDGSDEYFHKIAAIADNTHLTLSAAYTGTTGSGKYYRLFICWTDQWKDLGASYSNLKPLELYEDYIVIPISNKLAIISTTDDSLNTAAFTLPTGFSIVGTRSGENGLLIGANDSRNKGYLMLWDCLSDRAIAPWIPLEDTLKSIVKVSQGWIVIGTQKIYLTNGYSIQVLKENFPDDSLYDNYIYPEYFTGAAVIGKTLFIANSKGNRARSRKGIYAIDISTSLVEFISLASGEVYGETNFQIYALHASLGSWDSKLYLYYSSGAEVLDAVAQVFTWGQLLEVSDMATPFKPQWFISQPVGLGGNDKTLEAIILSMQYDFSANALPFSLEDLVVTVKACPIHKLFFQYGTHGEGGSGTKNEIYLVGLQGGYEPLVEVGDEITVLNGANAGEVRHVKAVNHGGLGTEGIATSNLASGGSGYAVGDQFNVNNGTVEATGEVIRVSDIGVVTSYILSTYGEDCLVSDNVPTTATSGSGTGLKINITSISGANLAITVDSNFTNTPEPGKPGYGIAGCEVSITPMKKIATLTIPHNRGIKDRFFADVKNRIKGRKFLVKVQIEGYNPYIEFGDIDVIYDDKGIK